MTTDTLDYLPGNLVRARGREWVVQADTHQGDGGSLLRLRPLGACHRILLDFGVIQPSGSAVV